MLWPPLTKGKGRKEKIDFMIMYLFQILIIQVFYYIIIWH